MIHESTIKKYEATLRSLLYYVKNKHYLEMSITDFRREAKVSASFVRACQRAGYVSANMGSRRKPSYNYTLNPEDVSPAHARVVAEYVGKLTKKHKEAKSQTELSKYSNEALIRELSDRGFTGTLSKTISINL